MIREITSPDERELVLTRGRMLAGSNEQYLAPEWLARPDIYCVAQENEYNGYHDDSQSLVEAFDVHPNTRWWAVRSAGRDKLSEPVEATDLVYHMTAVEGTDNFESYYYPSGFMIFSEDQDAVILYSSIYDFKLIAGSADFVRAYIDGSKVEPLQELRDWFQEDIEDARSKGIEKRVAALERTLDMALSQVKLPPAA